MQRESGDGGRFITFEGGEGSGKSTQAGILANRLARAGRKVFATREPGGSPAAEEIRETLLSGRVKQFGPLAEAVMFAVARGDHIENAIVQALHAGKWVICDRFVDSTRAYQGATAGVPRGLINALERLTVGDLSRPRRDLPVPPSVATAPLPIASRVRR
jgi:dTMP kinase